LPVPAFAQALRWGGPWEGGGDANRGAGADAPRR
jgi:hypothetical protein